MTMHYLAMVPKHETHWGIECYSEHSHVSIDYPYDEQPSYVVIVHWGSGSTRRFERFDQAMDYASRVMQQSEPML